MKSNDTFEPERLETILAEVRGLCLDTFSELWILTDDAYHYYKEIRPEDLQAGFLFAHRLAMNFLRHEADPPLHAILGPGRTRDRHPVLSTPEFLERVDAALRLIVFREMVTGLAAGGGRW